MGRRVVGIVACLLLLVSLTLIALGTFSMTWGLSYVEDPETGKKVQFRMGLIQTEILDKNDTRHGPPGDFKKGGVSAFVILLVAIILLAIVIALVMCRLCCTSEKKRHYTAGLAAMAAGLLCVAALLLWAIMTRNDFGDGEWAFGETTSLAYGWSFFVTIGGSVLLLLTAGVLLIKPI